MRLVKKILLSITLIFLSLIAVFAIMYNVLESKVKDKVVAIINETIAGEISVEKLSYTIFSTYPKGIVELEGAKLTNGAI